MTGPMFPTEKADALLDALVEAHCEAIGEDSEDRQVVGISAAFDACLGADAGDPEAEETAAFGALLAAVHRICVLEGRVEKADGP